MSHCTDHLLHRISISLEMLVVLDPRSFFCYPCASFQRHWKNHFPNCYMMLTRRVLGKQCVTIRSMMDHTIYHSKSIGKAFRVAAAPEFCIVCVVILAVPLRYAGNVLFVKFVHSSLHAAICRPTSALLQWTNHTASFTNHFVIPSMKVSSHFQTGTSER